MADDDKTISLLSARAIKAALLRSRERYDDDEFEMSFRAHNGREFEVREYLSGQFFMSEMRPIARIARHDKVRNAYDYLDEPRLKGIMDDPNSFSGMARGLGINPKEIVRTGTGIGRGSIFYANLEEVAEAVATALDTNRWYDSVDRAKLADPVFQAEMKRHDEEMSAAYREEQQSMHDAAVKDEHGLFKGLHGMLGPLSDGTKKAILSYLNAPTEERWDEIHSKIIKGHSTVWQAWIEVDREAPRSKPSDGAWPCIPDPDTLRDALRNASGADIERNGQLDEEHAPVVPMPFR